MSIKLNKVTKIFDNQKAVDEVSFELKPGEIVGFLGPNGAGKSTTMKMICGHIPATSGTIHVCGLNMEDNAVTIKSKIGYLPESNPLYLDMYVREYLNFIREIFKGAKICKSRIDEVIDLTGLGKEAHKTIGTLSKGYKQRVGLARAILHDPEILILDEATSGLDPNQIIEIRDLITKIGQQKTVLFSTHIMQEVEAICKRVIIINNGNVVADSPIDTLETGTNNQVFKIRFSNSLNENLVTSLKEFAFEKVNENTILVHSTENTYDLRMSIMKWAIEHDISIDELTNEVKDLENIFRKLTQ